MSEYLLGVIGTIILCALLTAIVPDGKTSGVIKSVSRMVCILAIVAPVLKYLRSGQTDLQVNVENNFFESVIQEDEDYIQYYSELRVRETERALAQELEERYQVSSEVELAWENVAKAHGKYLIDQIQIQQIKVTIGGELEENMIRDMYEYLTKNYCSEVLIE